MPTAAHDFDTRYLTFDEGTVDRIMRAVPTPRPPTFGDRLEAIRRLARQGLSDQQIGERVGRTSRTVLRWRRRWGIAGLPVGTNGATRPIQPVVWRKGEDGRTEKFAVRNL